MISGEDLYKVFTAVVPLYVAMILAYGSVRWWGIFTPDQCSGINRFVSIFAVPLLSFHFISQNNPYAMNLHFVAADVLQKLIVLAGLALWSRLPSYFGAGTTRLDWSITLFSLTTLPNTLAMGIPLLGAMYGTDSEPLLVQIVFLQSLIWYTLLIFLFEFRAARALIRDQFPETAAAIASLRVDPGVVSLEGGCAEMEAELAEDGRLHVTVRRSSASQHSLFVTPQPSNLTGGEIYSMSTSLQRSPRGSTLNNADFFTMFSSTPSRPRHAGVRVSSFSMSEVYSVHSARSNFDEQVSSKRVVPVDQPLNGLDSTENGQVRPQQMPPASVMTRLIIIMVWRKLIRNPNTYSSIIGLIWTLISCRWNFPMPAIVAKSIEILSNTGLGMAMFGLGLFMGLQPRIIACGYSAASYSMMVRFFAGPFTMGIASFAIGIRGKLLRLAIVQAALPQGIVPFVFAREYNLHPAILSTGVIFGLLISLPIALVYYIVADLVQ